MYRESQNGGAWHQLNGSNAKAQLRAPRLPFVAASSWVQFATKIQRSPRKRNSVEVGKSKNWPRGAAQGNQ